MKGPAGFGPFYKLGRLNLAATESVPGHELPSADPSVPRPWFAVHLLSLAAAVPILLWINRDQWFSGDEWVVITTRGLGSNPQRVSLFYPHFEHWVTIPILVYRALYSVFALHTYLPYTLVLIAVQLAVVHTLWRLLLRVGVNAGFATGVAALFAVLAIGWENLSTAWQITIIAPVALGFATLLLMPVRGPFGRRDLVGWVLLVVALMCSGVGVTMTIVVGIAALLRRGWRVAVLVVSVPGVLYAVWLVTEGGKGQRNTVALSTALRELPGFAWRGVTDALAGLTRVSFAGPIVLVLLVAWLVWRARPRTEPWPLVLATSAGAVVSIGLTGLRRAGADAGASRYAYVVVVLFLPAIALALQQLAQPVVRRFGRPAVWVCGGLVFVMCVVQVVALNHYVSTEFLVGQVRPRVLGTALLLREHEPIINPSLFGIVAEPSAPTIARLDRQGDLPSTAGTTRSDVLTASEYVQLVAADTGLFPEDRAALTKATRARVVAGSGAGCFDVVASGDDADVTLSIPAETSFRMTTGRELERGRAVRGGARSRHTEAHLHAARPGGRGEHGSHRSGSATRPPPRRLDDALRTGAGAPAADHRLTGRRTPNATLVRDTVTTTCVQSAVSTAGWMPGGSPVQIETPAGYLHDRRLVGAQEAAPARCRPTASCCTPSVEATGRCSCCSTAGRRRGGRGTPCCPAFAEQFTVVAVDMPGTRRFEQAVVRLRHRHRVAAAAPRAHDRTSVTTRSSSRATTGAARSRMPTPRSSARR